MHHLNTYSDWSKRGLPDGIFSNQKSQVGLTALEWKNLVYSMAIWNILQQFGTFYVTLVYFPPFLHIVQRQSGNPSANRVKIFYFTGMTKQT
jgi:hypothetical protein